MDSQSSQPPPDLAGLLDSWQIILRAENKALNTIRSYRHGVHKYLEWLQANGQPAEITAPHVQRYIAHLIDTGSEANTARLRLASLRAFTKWMVEDGELDDDPLVRLRPPKIPRKVVDALTDEQLKAMLRVCKGKRFQDKRDEAALRLMAETGLRAGEVVDLSVADVDVSRGLAIVREGKGGKGRTAPFGNQTAAALDRYMRARRSHKLAGTTALWLGLGGKEFHYHGLNNALRGRAKAAGIEGFHLHLLRHTAATRWLRAGGSEQGLMSVAGWTTRSMLDRYTGASAAERAEAEARGLGLGEL